MSLRARELVIAPGHTVSFYKLGLSLIFDEGYWQLLDRLTTSGKKGLRGYQAVRHSRNRRSNRQKAGRSRCFIRDGPRPRKDDSCGREEMELKIPAVTVLTSLDGLHLPPFKNALRKCSIIAVREASKSATAEHYQAKEARSG